MTPMSVEGSSGSSATSSSPTVASRRANLRRALSTMPFSRRSVTNAAGSDGSSSSPGSRPRGNSNGFNPVALLSGAFAKPINSVKTEVWDRLSKYAEDSAKENNKGKAESDHKLILLICYVVFLLAYSITAMQGRNSAALDPYTIYDMQHRLTSTITGNNNRGSVGRFGNTTLSEVDTVAGMYAYLRSTFHNAIYSAATFDGDPRFAGGGRSGFISGHMMLLGGIRISQGRTEKYDCMTKAPEGLFSELYEDSEQDAKDTVDGDESDVDPDLEVTDDEQSASWTNNFESGFYCYAMTTTNKRPYANSTMLCDMPDFDWLDPPNKCTGEYWGPYKYNPLRNEEVQASILTNLGYKLQTTGFGVTLPNRNGTRASQYYATLYHSKFIDLQTRFVNIDMAFWNFNVERLITIRLKFDMPISGGVYPTVQTRVADLYTCTIAKYDDAKLCSTTHIVKMCFEAACLIVIVTTTLYVILQVLGSVIYIFLLHFNVVDERTGFAEFCRSFGVLLRKKELSERGTTIVDRTSSMNFDGSDVTASLKKKDKSTLLRHAKNVFNKYPREWVLWQIFFLLQLSVYFTYLLTRFIAMQLVPMDVDVANDNYIDFQTPSLWANYSDRINSLFIFLSWVRLFEFFNFFSGRNLFLFVAMAFVFVLGSALSNLIALGYYVKDYSTFQKAFFTTLGALRGDLPYDDISNMMQSGFAGTAFGITYGLIFAYILFHLILALLYAAGGYMKKLYGADKYMQWFAKANGVKVEGSGVSDGGGDDRNSLMINIMRKGMQQVMGGGDVGGGEERGTKKEQNSGIMRVIDKVMKFGGYGVRNRSVSENRRASSSRNLISNSERSNDSTDSAGSNLPADPHHPEVIRHHSSIVMKKFALFKEMSHAVGSIFGTVDGRNTTTSVERKLEDLLVFADVETGQLPLTEVIAFFKNLGMVIGPSTQETLHSLFGQERMESDSLHNLAFGEIDENGHTCLTAFGLRVRVPHVKIESLSLIMLAALPLMSGDKNIRDIMPEMMKLEIVSELATDLVEHVAKVMGMHYETIKGADGHHDVYLPDSVIDGMDMIFNMVSAAMENMGMNDSWRDSCQSLLVSMKEGVHSLRDYTGRTDEVHNEFDNHARELSAIMADSRSTVVDVAHARVKFKRRLSLATGAPLSTINEHLEGDVSPSKKKDLFGWKNLKSTLTFSNAVDHGAASTFKEYKPEEAFKKDEDLREVGDFLSMVMESEEDEFEDAGGGSFYDAADDRL